MYLLHGAARKISLPVLGLAAVGWVTFVVGFGGFNNDDTFYNDIRQGDHTFTPSKEYALNYIVVYQGSEKDIDREFAEQRASWTFFPHWFYMISFPLLVATLILHLVFHSLFMFGVIGYFLLGLCMISATVAFWIDGSHLFNGDRYSGHRFQEDFEEHPHIDVDIFPDDWLSQRYYGLWLVVEFAGVIFCLLMLASLKNNYCGINN